MTDGDGNVGIVRKCTSRTKETFLSVKVLEGPKRGQWDKAYRYRPILDWSETGPEFRCINPDCGRWYRRPLTGETQPYCRTCAEVEAAEMRTVERQAEQLADTGRHLKRAKWDRETKHGA